MEIRKERLRVVEARNAPPPENPAPGPGEWQAGKPGSSVIPHPTPGSKVVIYWMQSAVRAHWNAALNHAANEARRLGLPLVPVFVLSPGYPEASLRHYWFMFQGLKECRSDLARLGLDLVVLRGQPPEILARAARGWQAALVITDQAGSGIQEEWRRDLAVRLACPLVEASGETLVPVTAAYPRQAWSAAVLRRRLKVLIPGFLDDIDPAPDTTGLARWTDPGTPLPAVDLQSLNSPQDLLDLLPGLSAEPGPVHSVMGGRSSAMARLGHFLENQLESYGTRHSDPGAQAVSGLSPWIHFGQTGVAEIVHAVLDHAVESMEDSSPRLAPGEARKLILGRLFEKAVPEEGVQAFLEEVLVRRDLAFNFCHYNDAHRSFTALPDWARATLLAHAGDPRPHIHTMAELEEGRTYDRVWNACQNQLRQTGTMHGYLRMYWGKKILEWSPHPEEAFDRAIYLNDKWALDGRDPNGWAGVAWCFGLHDRPWAERPVFGTVRYMNLAGLQRKFNLDPYLERWG